jgi:hypothetical protein
MLYQANPATGQYYASIDTMDDGAVARYQGLILSVTHRIGQHFTGVANFTDSYCLSDYDFGAALAGSTNSQPFNRHADWGPCISDTRSNFNLSLVAQSPWRSDNVWVNRLVKDWEVAPLFQARSGQPLNILTGTDNSLTGLGNDRPDQVLSDPYALSSGCKTAPCVQYLNPAAFIPNPVGTYGDVGRNAVRGPGYFGFDLAVTRTFQINEKFALQARAEAFNILNYVNFVGAIVPAGQPAGATYGTLSTTLNASTFGQITGAFDPRILQFALKLKF